MNKISIRYYNQNIIIILDSDINKKKLEYEFIFSNWIYNIL